MEEITIERTSKHREPRSAEPLRVAVLRGGIGREREVSLESGRCVAGALRAGGVEVVTSDVRPDDLQILDNGSIDVFFLALHGEFGEDGRLQQILEGRGLLYTGCGPEASQLAFDKIASKRRFAVAGVNVPPDVEVRSDESPAEIEERLKPLGERFVVKPIRQGSSVGVHIVDGRREAAQAARQVHGEFGDAMIERFVPGRELTVGILGRQALPIIEIRSRSGFYDYHAKYVSEQTQYLFDTVEDEHVRAEIGRAARACFDALGCRDFARVDFILGNDGTAYALEVNTIPGFTTHSLLPKAAARTGLSMTELCVGIVRTAFLERSGKSR